MSLMKFKEFARDTFRKEIVKNIKVLKGFKKCKTINREELLKDNLYLFFLKEVINLFHFRQHNLYPINKFKNVYSMYSTYIKNNIK